MIPGGKSGGRDTCELATAVDACDSGVFGTVARCKREDDRDVLFGSDGRTRAICDGLEES